MDLRRRSKDAGGCLCQRDTSLRFRLPQKRLVATAARLLKKGFLVTMDYGFKDSENFHLPAPKRTCAPTPQHRLGDDPFEAIGQQDLTAQGIFPARERQGRQQGLKTHGWKSQEAFMHQCLESLLKTGQTLDAHECNHFKTLMHPEHFGHRFQVLIQQRKRSDGSTPIHPARVTTGKTAKAAKTVELRGSGRGFPSSPYPPAGSRQCARIWFPAVDVD